MLETVWCFTQYTPLPAAARLSAMSPETLPHSVDCKGEGSVFIECAVHDR